MTDFVILWLDNSDPQWLKSYNQYAPQDKQLDVDDTAARYRDWGCLRYWFRGIEQFAPWVRKVHLVTNGQVPEWLNTDYEKLHLVNHKDIMPEESLPTFNAPAIEVNIHRIEGLSEQFVYWNDDFYLTGPISEERFFKHGEPTDMAVGNVIQSDGVMGHITLNGLDAINRHFMKRAVMKNSKWWNWSYGTYLLRTLALLPWPRFTGFFDHHLPQGYLKSEWEEVWKEEDSILGATTYHRFRSAGDVNQWLFRYWQLVKGRFSPMNVVRDSSVFQLTDTNWEEAMRYVREQKKNIIVLNDSNDLTDIEHKQQQMQEAFEHILPKASCFEKQNKDA